MPQAQMPRSVTANSVESNAIERLGDEQLNACAINIATASNFNTDEPETVSQFPGKTADKGEVRHSVVHQNSNNIASRSCIQTTSDREGDFETPGKRKRVTESQSSNLSQRSQESVLRSSLYTEKIKVNFNNKSYIYTWDGELKTWRNEGAPFSIRGPYPGNLDFLDYVAVRMDGYRDPIFLYPENRNEVKTFFRGDMDNWPGWVMDVSLGEVRDMLNDPVKGPFVGHCIRNPLLRV